MARAPTQAASEGSPKPGRDHDGEVRRRLWIA
jgi:hypothetical protein